MTPRRRAWPQVLAGLLLTLLGIAALYQLSDDASGESAEGEIARLVRVAFTTNDPDDCTVLYTRRFLEQVHDEDGSPVEECRENSEGPPDADSVRVSSLVVDSDSTSARVTVRLAGGELGDSEVTTDLSRQPDGWKFDRFVDIDLDRPAFDASVRAEAVREGATAGEGACYVAQLHREFGREELENQFVDPETDRLEYLALRCLGAETLRRQFAKGLREGFYEKGITVQVADCVVRRVNRGLDPNQLRLLLADDSALRNVLRNITVICAREHPGRGSPPA